MLTSRASTRRRTDWPSARPVSRSHRLPPAKSMRASCQRASRSATVARSKAPRPSPSKSAVAAPSAPPPASTSATGPQARTWPRSSSTKVSARRATSSSEWVTYSMGMWSWSRSRSSQGKTSWRRAWSKDAKGSSSSSKRGWVVSARAIATRWRSPPDSSVGCRPNKPPIPSRSIAFCKTTAPEALLARCRPNCKLPRTSRCSNRLASWNT